MNEGKQREIFIAMFKYSVVVKGIERKLTDLDFKVTTVSERLDDHMEHSGGRAALFILYLTGDIAEDSAQRAQLFRLCGIAEDKKQKILLIGEERSYEDLMNHLPALRSYAWINRPVNMELLEQTVFRVVDNIDPASGETIADKKPRILIVDDDPSYAKMVREWIKDKYRVDIVTAGMQAITFLLKVRETEPINMILLDYEMPVVDGPQVLQMLRQEPQTANIPVVFLTGIGTKEAVGRVMELKPDGYVLKSTTREDLLAFLAKKIK